MTPDVLTEVGYYSIGQAVMVNTQEVLIEVGNYNISCMVNSPEVLIEVGNYSIGHHGEQNIINDTSFDIPYV